MTTVRAVPLFEGAIHNPANERHFMSIKPVERRVRIYAGDLLLADTTNAVRVIEIGKTVYDPIFYVPAEDVTAPLEPVGKSTHCPIKGDASYFALKGEEIAWSYEKPIDIAEGLSGRRAFWASKVRVEEGS